MQNTVKYYGFKGTELFANRMSNMSAGRGVISVFHWGASRTNLCPPPERPKNFQEKNKKSDVIGDDEEVTYFHKISLNVHS